MSDAGVRPPPRVEAGAPPLRDAGTRGDAARPQGDDAGPPVREVDAGPGSDLTPAERDLLDALNDARVANGQSPVTPDPELMCAARRHALDVGGNGSCGHVGSDGSWPWDRAMACGFPQERWTVNEIAAGPGFRDGADAVSGWRQSSGHWAALIHPRASTVGVAVYETCFIALFDCCVAGSE
ncbi:MAG: CAP domain-containing protein [Sandaracinaceae bacterium]